MFLLDESLMTQLLQISVCVRAARFKKNIKSVNHSGWFVILDIIIILIFIEKTYLKDDGVIGTAICTKQKCFLKSVEYDV